MVEIREVTTRKELKKFILFPFQLYKKNRYWVPPLIHDELNTLRRDRNPAFEHCESRYWLAYQNKQIAGRIAAIINKRYIEQWGKKYVKFGWVDFKNSIEVSQSLFNVVETWAKSRGLVGAHGPLGFTDNDPEGMLIEGFDELGTMPDIYNYPYYKEHIEKCGYVKDVDWVEYQIKIPEKVPERIKNIENELLKRNKFKILDARRKKELLPYARRIFPVYNKAYKDLFGFTPLTEKQIDDFIRKYYKNVVPDYFKIVLDKNDEIAGFIIGSPSLSKALQRAKGRLFPIGFLFCLHALSNSNKYVDLYLAGVKPDLQGRGVNAILASEFTRSCIKNKIIIVNASKQLEKNILARSHMNLYETRQHKRRRCYVKHFHT
jgi:hypothetical protein